jgi:hypothetical protein
MSASPRARIASADGRIVDAVGRDSGIRTAPLSRRVTHANAPRGTIVAMVGMRASCQPMPVLMIVAPARSTPARARPPRPTCCRLDQVEHRQAVDDDEVAPDRFARAAHDLDGKRMRFSKAPPHSSSRWFVRGATNWLIR